MSFAKSFKINNSKIGINSPVYFIADIAANHDGSLKRAKDLIKKCADAGANAAKFQHFDANTIISKNGFKNKNNDLSHQKKWEKSVFEVYKDASINLHARKIQFKHPVSKEDFEITAPPPREKIWDLTN